VQFKCERAVLVCVRWLVSGQYNNGDEASARDRATAASREVWARCASNRFVGGVKGSIVGRRTRKSR